MYTPSATGLTAAAGGAAGAGGAGVCCATTTSIPPVSAINNARIRIGSVLLNDFDFVPFAVVKKKCRDLRRRRISPRRDIRAARFERAECSRRIRHGEDDVNPA